MTFPAGANVHLPWLDWQLSDGRYYRSQERWLVELGRQIPLHASARSLDVSLRLLLRVQSVDVDLRSAADQPTMMGGVRNLWRWVARNSEGRDHPLPKT